MTDSEKCVDELLKRIAEIDTIISDGCTDDRAREKLKSIQTFIDNNQALIPGYCLKKAVDSIRRLENLANKSQESQMKFKFSKSTGSNTGTASATPKMSSAAVPKIDIVPRRCNENITLNPAEVDSKDVTLTRLDSSKVVVKGLANTIYISDLKDTSVEGVACRAVTIKECTNCRFRLVCQQLRIDSTRDSDFEIFTSARSMLESSNGLVFRQLKPDDDTLDLMAKCNMDTTSNNWRCIDDFDWLSPNAPSQHYRLVEEDN